MSVVVASYNFINEFLRRFAPDLSFLPPNRFSATAENEMISRLSRRYQTYVTLYVLCTPLEMRQITKLYPKAIVSPTIIYTGTEEIFDWEVQIIFEDLDQDDLYDVLFLVT